MQKKHLLFALLGNLLRKISINAVRASIIALAYLLRALYKISEIGLSTLSWAGKFFDVHILTLEVGSELNMTRTFTDEEILSMARSVNENDTIQSISGKMSISYRQARRVSEARKNCLRVNCYSLVNKVV